MKWFCFKFWFYYRLFMACLQHFNFCVSLYTNCVYFVLWKSYDLLWFWMHIMLCTCFPSLRSENYLLVWCNLIKMKRTRYPRNTYKEIYLMLYGGTGTKAEAALEDMAEREQTERVERRSRRSRRNQSRERARRGEVVPEEELESSSTSDSEEEQDEIDTMGKQNGKSHTIPDIIREEEEEECRKYVRVGSAVEDSNKDLEAAEAKAAPVPPPRRHRARRDHVELENGRVTFGLDNAASEDAKEDETSSDSTPDRPAVPTTSRSTEETEVPQSGEESDTNSTSKWLDKVPGVPKAIRNRFRKSNSSPKDPEPERPPWVKPPETTFQKIKSALTGIKPSMPSIPKFGRSASTQSSPRELDILKPDYTNTYDILDPKAAARREKHDRKALTKRVRGRIREQLREAARKERKRRMITDAIELILSLLRMITSFAVLVGNIRKTFLPAQIKYLQPGQHHYDYYLLNAIFRVTTFMDVTMFSLNFMWIYCLQWHLFCRLGFCRFWFWCGVLVTIAVTTMVWPMSVAMADMDISWCQFKNGSSLAKYQPSWRRH